MSTGESISYTVLARDKAGWQPQGTSGDMQTALAAANDMLSSKRFKAVKVDKQFFDPANQRFVTATILERSESAGISTPILVLYAILGGIASFAVTYLAVEQFL